MFDLSEHELPAFNPPSAEQLLAQRRARIVDPLDAAGDEQLLVQRRERTFGPLDAARAAMPGVDVFKAVSLVDWSRIAAAAGIEHIPAQVVCTIPVDVISRCEEPSASDGVHWVKMDLARASLLPGEMMRWDCCSSLDMKCVMGDALDNASAHETDPLNSLIPVWKTVTTACDPRFFDIAMEYPGDAIALVKRPWIAARREGSHPVEYRVFVKNGEIEGLANYYLQRDLELNPITQSEVGACLGMTQQLLDHMDKVQALPYNVMSAGAKLNLGFDEGLASFTADYLVDETGKVQFIEAGPPFGLGAHPCAFVDNLVQVEGSTRAIIGVQGVCLGRGQTPLPLADFSVAAKKAHRSP